MIKIAAALCVVLAACTCRPKPSPAALAACPDPAVVQAIHAAAYQFEHANRSEAHTQIARANAQLKGAPDATTRQLIAQLAQADQLFDQKPEEAKNLAEAIRASLKDWVCLTDELHERFHADLPR
jgi:hypothetical protein